MRNHAHACQGQLSLFDCLPEDKGPKTDYKTLFVVEVDGDLWWFLDAEQTLFFGSSEDSPLMRKILKNVPVHWHDDKHTWVFERVIWVDSI